MYRRFPLLRAVILLSAALVVAAVSLLGFVRVPRMAIAPGHLAISGRPGSPDSARFICVADTPDHSLLAPGQPARIRLNAYPWMQKGTLSGHVSALLPSALPSGGYGLVLAVDPGSAPGPLVDGLPGEARITTGESESLGRLLFSRMRKDTP